MTIKEVFVCIISFYSEYKEMWKESLEVGARPRFVLLISLSFKVFNIEIYANLKIFSS